MELGALLLARIQFAFVLGYHIIFPTLSIGLALYLAIQQWLALRTGDPRYQQTFDFWLKIFALTFGMGVVSGVVLSYTIGTTFGRFSELAGAVVGPLMSYEVMTAFFLEAGFLGIMLFGRDRVGPKVHMLATALVAIGTLLSAFWILSANSWMHTPAGYRLEGEAILPSDWSEAIFNPSFPYRFTHMVLASFLTTSFVIAAIGAWFVRHKEHHDFGMRNLRAGLIGAAILAPLQIFVGDLHGLNTLEHQPIKIAAMEGHWHSGGEVPLLLFAIPDQDAEKNHFEIGIPKLASFILTHSTSGELQGLTSVQPDMRPPVAPVFFSFRVMVGCGLLMLALAWFGIWQWWRGKLEQSGRFLHCLNYSAPLGFIAIIAGWLTTEIGRQPWTVHGLIKTSEAASMVSASKIGFTLTSFAIVYAVLFAAFLWYVRYLMKKGPPQPGEGGDAYGESGGGA